MQCVVRVWTREYVAHQRDKNALRFTNVVKPVITETNIIITIKIQVRNNSKLLIHVVVDSCVVCFQCDGISCNLWLKCIDLVTQTGITQNVYQ